AVADAAAQEARGCDRRLRDDGGHARHRQPDSREQDLPHRLVGPDRPQARHVPDGREPVPAVEGRPGREGRGGPAVVPAHRPGRRTWPPRSTRRNAARRSTSTRTRMRTRTKRILTRTKTRTRTRTKTRSEP